MTRVRTAIAFACAAVVALVLAATAHAASWSTPVMLDANAYSTSTPPAVGVDDAGDATAAWTSYDADTEKYSIQVAAQPAGGSWSAPVTFDGDVQNGGEPVLAVDSAGDAVVLWSNHAGTTASLLAASRPAGGSWSAPVTLDDDMNEDPVVAIDKAGNATAVWDHIDPNASHNTSLVTASLPAGGSWSAPTTLDADSDGGAALAVDQAGDATVAWSHVNTATITFSLKAASRPAGGSWSTPATVEDDGDYGPGGAAVAIDQAGDATLMWTYYNGSDGGFGSYSLHSSSLPAGGSWSTPVSLNSEVTDYGYQVAMDKTGDATAVWTEYAGSGKWSLVSADLPAGGSWSSPVTLDDNDSGTPMALAMDQAGATTLVWDSSGGLVASSRAANGSWPLPPVSLDTSLGQGAPAVGTDSSGDATAVWTTGGSSPGLVASSMSSLPSVAITGGPSGLTNSRSASFTFDSGEDGTEYQCQLDGGGWSSCTSPKSYAGVADGAHTFEVRAYNSGTDSGGPPTSQSWTVDGTPPHTSITSGPSGTVSSSSVQFGFSSTEDGSTFTCSLDGAAPAGCSSPQSYAGLADGSHTFKVWATDAAGNADSAGSSRSFTVDTQASPGQGPGAICPVSFAARAASAHAAACGSASSWPSAATCPRGTVDHVSQGPLVAQAMSAGACFKPISHGWQSAGPVRVDGLTFTYGSGGSLKLYDSGKVSSSAATISLGQGSPLSLPAPPLSRTLKGHDASWTFEREGKFAGAKTVGGVELKMSSDDGGSVQASVELSLPEMNLTQAAAHGVVAAHPSGGFSFTVSNDNGPSYSGHVKVDQAWLWGVEVHNLTLSFDSQTGSFTGEGTVDLPAGEGVETPPSATLGLTITGERLTGGKIDLQDLNKPLTDGFFLQRLGLELQTATSPPFLSGTAGVSFGPDVNLGFFKGELLALEGTGKLTQETGGPAIEATGTGSLANIPVAHADVKYASSSGKVTFSGDVGYKSGSYELDAVIKDGKIDSGTGFSLTGQATVDMPRLPFQLHGDAYINRRGAVGCIGPAGFRWGFGLQFGGKLQPFAGNCDIGKWSAANASAHAATALTLPARLPQAVFGIVGAGAPPQVTLSGPGGQHVDATQPQAVANLVVIQDPASSTTYVRIAHPAGGAWTITPAAGSAPVTQIERAEGLPAPRVKVSVSRRGARRTLSYRLKRIPGQKIMLTEQGAFGSRTIATVTRAHGHIRFTPAAGPGGRRKIVALVVQYGLPRASLVAGSYVAPRPKAPKKVRGLRLVHRGRTVTARWRRSRGARSYLVIFTASDGRTVSVSTRHRSARLGHVARGVRVKVAVMAVGATHRTSRPTTAR